MSAETIISSDLRKRMSNLQKKLVSHRLDKWTKKEMHSDLSQMINIGFVLLGELEELYYPKISNKDNFINIENGQELTPKAKPTATRVIRDNIFKHNEVLISSDLSKMIYNKAESLAKKPDKFFSIVCNLRSYVATAILFDRISGQYKYVAIMYDYLNSDRQNIDFKVGEYNINCRWTHRKDSKKYFFKSEFDDEELVVLVTGDCERECSVNNRLGPCNNLDLPVCAFPRGYMFGIEIKEKARNIDDEKFTLLVSNFEKNSFDLLLEKANVA